MTKKGRISLKPGNFKGLKDKPSKAYNANTQHIEGTKIPSILPSATAQQQLNAVKKDGVDVGMKLYMQQLKKKGK